MAIYRPDLELVSLADEPGVWFDPARTTSNRRYITTEEAAARTALSVETLRASRDTEGLLLAIDRGKRRPRFVYPETQIERLRQELAIGSLGSPQREREEVSVRAMFDEMQAELQRLREERVAWQQKELGYLEAISKLEKARRADLDARKADAEARDAVDRVLRDHGLPS